MNDTSESENSMGLKLDYFFLFLRMLFTTEWYQPRADLFILVPALVY